MSVTLRFPGDGMLIGVPSDTRLEMFPRIGNLSAYENVEYHIGSPPVCFVVKRVVLESQPENFLATQMSRCIAMRSGLSEEERGDCLRVVLNDLSPTLFPLVFCFLNQTFDNPSIACIPMTGLSPEEIAEVTRLVEGVICIKSPLTSLLFKAKRPLVDANGIQFTFSGRLAISSEGQDCGHMGQTAVSEDGRITHTNGSGAILVIDLHKIPTAVPWPHSLMEDQPLFPGAVDHSHTFFVPAVAILCVTNGKRIICEGIYFTEEDKICVKAIDQEAYGMVWAEIQVLY